MRRGLRGQAARRLGCEAQPLIGSWQRGVHADDISQALVVISVTARCAVGRVARGRPDSGAQ